MTGSGGLGGEGDLGAGSVKEVKENEFVERLAKALSVRGHEAGWEHLPTLYKRLYREDVRRVLLAAMEPTQEMQRAANSWPGSTCLEVWKRMMWKGLEG